MYNIETIWNRIKKHEGEQFFTITGIAYDFSVDDEYVILHNTNQKLPKTYFEQALTLMPLKKPSDLKKLPREPRGTSYIYGILMDKDKRICD